jgi:hypothetical protein
VLLPCGAAFLEDANEEVFAALVAAGLAAGQFGFGGDKAASTAALRTAAL